MLWDVFRRCRGREVLVFTGDRPKAVRQMKRLQNAQRKGIHGIGRVEYRMAVSMGEKYQRPAASHIRSGDSAGHPRVPR